MASGIIDGNTQLVPLLVPIVRTTLLNILYLVTKNEVLEHIKLDNVENVKEDTEGLEAVNHNCIFFSLIN